VEVALIMPRSRKIEKSSAADLSSVIKAVRTVPAASRCDEVLQHHRRSY